MKLLFVSADIVDLPFGKPLELKKALALFDRSNEQLSLDKETSEITYQLIEAEEVLFESTVDLPKESFNLLQEIENALNDAEIESEGRDALLAFITSRFPTDFQKGRKPQKKEKKSTITTKEQPVSSILAIVFLENEDTELPTEQLFDLREGIALLNKENQRLEKADEPLELDYQLLHEDVLFYESTLFLPEENFDFSREIQQELTDADGAEEDINELLGLLASALGEAKEKKRKLSPVTAESQPRDNERTPPEKPWNRKPLRLPKKAPENESVKPTASMEARKLFGGFFSSRKNVKKPPKTKGKGKKQVVDSVSVEPKERLSTESKQATQPKEKPESHSGKSFVMALILAFCVWSVCLLGVCVYVLHEQANEQAASIAKLQQANPTAPTSSGQESTLAKQVQGQAPESDTKKQTEIMGFAQLFLTKFYNRQDNDDQYRKQLGAWIDSKDLKGLHNPDEEAATILPWKIEQSGDHWNVAYLVQSQSNDDSHLVTFQVTESAVDQFQVNSPITQTTVSVNHVK